MKLYNQTKNHLRWAISLTQYQCEPWGEVTVPDMFVEHCKARGLPLSTVPVAAEVRAGTNLEDATAAARKDEIVALQKTVSEATASEKVAKAELDKALATISELNNSLNEEKLNSSQTKSKYEALISDHSALMKVTDEQARSLEISENARKRAEATVAELQSVKQEAKPEQKKQGK
jgi:hypothetical protein